MTALVQAAPASAPVTHLGERLLWTAAMIAVLVALYLLMWRGWRRRAARHANLPQLPVPPARGEPPLAQIEGQYVSTTTEGDWLDRVVAQGLGAKGDATLELSPIGVMLDRRGAPRVFVPAGSLRGVRREPGMAGKFVESGGLLVVTWQHGERLLDTGFRARRAAEADTAYDILQSLVGTEPTR